MSITYKLNKERNGVEIKFTEKPSDKVRAKLKELGFRWSQFQGVWYAKQSPETIAFAKELASEEGEQISLTIEEEVKEATRKVVERNEKKAGQKKENKKSKPEPKKVVKKVEEPEEVEEDTTETEAKTELPEIGKKPKKDNIVIFPKARPDIKVAVTEGEWTYNDCKAKLDYERKIFADSDSQFVIDGLLKMCEINQNFRNNVMRADKSYQGAFEYFMGMARKGFALQYQGVTFLDNNLALGFAMDYFNSADVPKEVVNGAIVKQGAEQ